MTCHINRSYREFSTVIELHLESARNLRHIQIMSKTAKNRSTATTRRSAETGHALARTKESAVIENLPFKPVSFTVRELRKVIRDVRSREHSASAG
jgi:hypothetical protein